MWSLRLEGTRTRAGLGSRARDRGGFGQTARPPRAGKVLGNLQLNLLSKSKVYEDPALSAIFLHNNYNYILKALEK